jgi:hypothetical protein
MTLQFEAHVRSVLACGCSARQARDNMLLNARFLLPAALVPTQTLTLTLILTLLLTLTLTQPHPLPLNLGKQVL